ncbi:MAG: hypothetical protein MZV64_09930 [Ignavibacteriales bacterium]|nr:hypothetical protein [Ignavibacteriales bacterium]
MRIGHVGKKRDGVPGPVAVGAESRKVDGDRDRRLLGVDHDVVHGAGSPRWPPGPWIPG